MNMQVLLKQAQQMQKELGKVEHELEQKEYKATMGGNMISVMGKGNMEITSISIDDSIFKSESKEDIEMMIQSAVNDVLKQAKADKDKTVNSVTGGVKVPGGF